MIDVRVAIALLTLTLTGPSVGALLCDWACATKHQLVATSTGGCHDHGTDASMPTWQRGHQCHEVSKPPASVLTSTPSLLGVLAATDPTLTIEASPQLGDGSQFHLHGPPHGSPPLPAPLRV